MKRLALHLILALFTFAVGVSLPPSRKAPTLLTPGEIDVCLTKVAMCADQDLARRLVEADIEYTNRCLIYPEGVEEYQRKRDSGWINKCFREWEEARRVAVEGE